MESPAVDIEALSEDGQGVAEFEGKPLLVDSALPGEQVSLAGVRRGRHFHRAACGEILRRCAQRVTPPCPYYGVCGGCRLQHLAAAAQREYKQQQLAQRFRRQAGLAPRQWGQALFGPAYGYRRRARLAVRHLPGRGLFIGFRQKNHSYICDIGACAILEPRLSALIEPLHELVAALSCSRRLPQIEVAAGDADVAAVFRHLEPLSRADREALEAFALSQDVRIFTQAGGPDTAQALAPGDPSGLYYDLPRFGLRIEFGPTDFVQANAGLNRQLVAHVVEALALTANDRVVELFAGVGNFSLALATRAAAVDAIEAVPRLVERGRRNSESNRRANIQWHTLDLREANSQLPPLYAGANKLLLDPPREGALHSLKALPAGAVERMVYVSCNPATLARDCAYLVSQKGFELLELRSVDMFPQTTHSEAVAVLRSHHARSET